MNNVNLLMQEQITILSEIIKEQFGSEVSFEIVNEYSLGLFDDIAGLECITDSKQQEIINDIWADIQSK